MNRHQTDPDGVSAATSTAPANLSHRVFDVNLLSYYRARDKPWYRLGHGIVLMYIVIGWVTSLAFIVLLRRENEKRARGERDELITGVEGKA
ncbi:hypothetical protein FRC08_017715, partial [Ceratobasidium sp. 394]